MQIERRAFLASAAAAGIARAARAASPMGQARGPVQANWPSLVDHYRYPDWFRDAKLGIWSHWGPQAVPEQGDWYGRFMYMQGHPMYEHHVRTYGHPSKFGMKDIHNLWKAERWDPEALMSRFVKAGAKYFMSLGCHHDNLDCYDSRYHAWNATRVGPKRDVVGIWAKAARAAGLKFGISNHVAHAWHWYQPAYGYDPVGPHKGERYDAFRLRKGDGAGQWWDGLDPQELYTGPHAVMPNGIDSVEAMNKWHDANNGQWVEHGPPGDTRFVTNWLLRQTDMIEKYRPDMVYFDDYGLPFGPVGLEAAADYYNRSIRWHGKIDVVLTAKQLKPHERFGVVQDVERGFTDRLWDEPWQTDTCIGDWFYNVARLNDRSYKTAEMVMQRLCDVVSKNGNLLLSVPQRGDGSIDSEEDKILDGMARWIAINSEAIYGSRPWHRYGEGPTVLTPGMQNEGNASAFKAQDIRFTTNKGALYAAMLAWPEGPVTIASLARGKWHGEVGEVTFLGGGPVRHHRDARGLHLTLPSKPIGGFVPVVRIDGRGL
ncbi:alpha-L-fucosidase [Sphingomonas xinjiangensis]|uniref:alpha-L-fucosidase n=1 Tax=Sphingomonas xinjiangensis TaxID=643568 RepID=A0A840YS86_9SPHN|nr:alpha-L-fucosidase [Sphingomonas xinjiangensis]MBB5712546.1 alpha-L-fucosidase [Sphingomonas xinjiangensis]